MITVEKVIENDKKDQTEVAKNNEELLKTGTVSAVKKSYWPWVLLAGTAILALWYFVLRKKGTETSEGVHS